MKNAFEPTPSVTMIQKRCAQYSAAAYHDHHHALHQRRFATPHKAKTSQQCRVLTGLDDDFKHARRRAVARRGLGHARVDAPDLEANEARAERVEAEGDDEEVAHAHGHVREDQDVPDLRPGQRPRRPYSERCRGLHMKVQEREKKKKEVQSARRSTPNPQPCVRVRTNIAKQEPNGYENDEPVEVPHNERAVDDDEVRDDSERDGDRVLHERLRARRVGVECARVRQNLAPGPRHAEGMVCPVHLHDEVLSAREAKVSVDSCSRRV